MIESTYDLNGLEKASVLLMSLGSEASAKVLERLSAEEQRLIGAQIVKMRDVKSVVRQRVLDEVNEIVKGNKLQDKSESADPKLSTPLRWMEKLNPADVADMLVNERPQNIALVVAHLSPSAAASLLTRLNDKTRDQVAHRLATMGNVSEEAVKIVDELMRARAFNRDNAKNNPKSPEAVLDMLGGATTRAKESILAALSRTESQMKSQMPSAPCTLEDLLCLMDVEIKTVLSKVDYEDLSVALRVASDELKSAVLRNVPETAAAYIRASIDAPIHTKISEIESAQQRIIDAMGSLSRNVEAVLE